VSPPHGGEVGVAAFRKKLLAAMALVVLALTLTGLYLAERSVGAETQHDLRVAFVSELDLVRTVRDIRHASLAERCRTLVRKPRIHAALEEDALDLLYPSAKDELGDALPASETAGGAVARQSIRPRFYRFLNIAGAVIPPVNTPEVGTLAPEEERRLALAGVPQEQQNGTLVRSDGEIVEIIATPIPSTETGEAIAALVAGFPVAANERPQAGLQSGLWLEGKLHLPSLSERAREALEREVARVISLGREAAAKGLLVDVDGTQQMLFVERLNPGSLFPPAYEVGVFPLAGLLARQGELRWKATLAGVLLLGIGIAASFYISARLAAPVRELAAISAENRVLRERAEAALEIKRAELERSARFSADASHQLKTPVSVLRAGLDELVAREEISSEVREELSMLVHQTFRLTSIIEDLLLLSRVDSGRLQLSLSAVDLTHVVETCVDDLRLLHDDTVLEVQSEVPAELHVAGDARYTMLIVENLLENARKYGSPGAPIRITARQSEGVISLVVANRGAAIPKASWEPIFERFHRGAVGGNIPGHGLGLNLARELARLHGGDLRLLRSDGEWTEFEARFRPADATAESMAAA
jgi:signal transduction histidine kinase